MPDSESPQVLPSDVDPDYECVRVTLGQQAAEAPELPGAGAPDPRREPLCPPGYVPRLRRRPPYQLRGKEVVSQDPPEENPEPPPPRP